MSLLKHQVSASMKRKSLNFYSVGKTAIANILKQGKTLIKNFEFFKGTYEKRTHGKYHILNEILYDRYGKCSSSNTYPDWALLQEEAMQIKKD